MDFSEKVTIITGAASGIGKDAAIEFAKLGANLVLVDLNRDQLKTVVDQINASGSPAPLSIAADVTEDAETIIKQTVQHFGQINILVNCAGISQTDTASTIDLDKFDRIFSINCRSIVELTKHAIPFLEKTKGNVVNVSSFCGLKGNMKLTSYSMSKAAVDMYTKCASLELAPKGIRVNAINPGTIRTPIFQSLGIDEKEMEATLKETAKRYPIGRVGDVSDTTNAILFLANDESSFINGISLSVDGGRLNF